MIEQQQQQKNVQCIMERLQRPVATRRRNGHLIQSELQVL